MVVIQSLREQLGFTADGNRAKVLAILSANIGHQVPWSEIGLLAKTVPKVRARIKAKRLKYKIIKEIDGGLVSYGLYPINEVAPQRLNSSEEKIIRLLLSASGELTFKELAIKYYEPEIPCDSKLVNSLVRSIEKKTAANNAPYMVLRRPRPYPLRVRLVQRR